MARITKTESKILDNVIIKILSDIPPQYVEQTDFGFDFKKNMYFVGIRSGMSIMGSTAYIILAESVTISECLVTFNEKAKKYWSTNG